MSDWLPADPWAPETIKGGWDADTVVKTKPLPPEIDQNPVRQEYPEKEGETLWLRRWKLTIGTESGDQALDLSDLAFEFRVDQALNISSWGAEITVYNVDDTVISKMQNEFTYVYLEAGYKGSSQFGKLFGGPIAYYKHGRKDATDTFVEIHAIQNTLPMQQIINTWLPAGYTKADVVRAALEVMTPYGVSLGQVSNLGDDKSPRGRVLHGMATDVLRDVGATADAAVWIDGEGKLHVLSEGEALEMATDTVPILNSRTGLLAASQTLGQGIEIRCLLNPKLIPGGQVKVAEKDVASRYQDVNSGAAGVVQSNAALIYSSQSLKHDGYYAILAVKHWGQNRGNPWYSDITSEPIDPTKQKPQLRTSV